MDNGQGDANAAKKAEGRKRDVLIAEITMNELYGVEFSKMILRGEEQSSIPKKVSDFKAVLSKFDTKDLEERLQSSQELANDFKNFLKYQKEFEDKAGQKNDANDAVGSQYYSHVNNESSAPSKPSEAPIAIKGSSLLPTRATHLFKDQ